MTEYRRVLLIIVCVRWSIRAAAIMQGSCAAGDFSAGRGVIHCSTCVKPVSAACCRALLRRRSQSLRLVTVAGGLIGVGFLLPLLTVVTVMSLTGHPLPVLTRVTRVVVPVTMVTIRTSLLGMCCSMRSPNRCVVLLCQCSCDHTHR